jgi:hypothetical protein
MILVWRADQAARCGILIGCTIIMGECITQEMVMESAAVHMDGADRNLTAMSVANPIKEHVIARAKFRLTVLSVVSLVTTVEEVN